jgi:hypothetical protein
MLVLKNHALSKWHMLKYVNSGTRKSHDHVLDTNRPSREPTNSSFHELPSGKHTQNYGKSSLKQWVNQLQIAIFNSELLRPRELRPPILAVSPFRGQAFSALRALSWTSTSGYIVSRQ